MLTKRIIPCLDVANGSVVKGVGFKNHTKVGSIIELSEKYDSEGADELVFYDIKASTTNTLVSKNWVREVAKNISIPFCVAGGISSVNSAREILNSGADKVSVNSPAIEDPLLIKKLANEFGSQCVVVGIDTFANNNYYSVHAKTGSEETSHETNIETIDWINIVQEMGAGEIVLNCMNQDGRRSGFDLKQIKLLQKNINVPFIASGGAGSVNDFVDLFKNTNASGGLAASIFHKNIISLANLKNYLRLNKINIRNL